MTNARDTWSVAEAKAHLSRVISEALESGPQTITKARRKVAVVVAFDEWERRTKRRGTLADFFAKSPLRGSNIKIERTKDLPRDMEP